MLVTKTPRNAGFFVGFEYIFVCNLSRSLTRSLFRREPYSRAIKLFQTLLFECYIHYSGVGLESNRNCREETLDRVLVACLRLFARRGREVRLQRQMALRQTATNDPVSASPSSLVKLGTKSLYGG